MNYANRHLPNGKHGENRANNRQWGQPRHSAAIDMPKFTSHPYYLIAAAATIPTL
jgi:hypothetical protein